MAGYEAAVTGIGLVTPAGVGTENSWQRVCSGKPTAASDPELAGVQTEFSCRVAGFEAAGLLGPREARRLDRFVQFAVVAGREAIADAGLDPARWDGARVGVVLGCAGYGAQTLFGQHRQILAKGPEEISSLLMPMHLNNMPAGQLAIDFSAYGPNFVVSTACASGTTAVGTARDLLRLDRCDIVITGGTDAMISPLLMAGFARMRASSRRNEDPAAACRPFDVGRDGLVAAEGAAILVLERPEHAAARGARVRGRIVGYGASADAHHVTAPDPEGAGLERALRAALADAGADPADVDHVNAHGTSTKLNDLTEARVLRRVLGTRPLVTSTKGVTGHMFGATGAAEAAFTVLALERGLVPPTANLVEMDPGIDIDVVDRPVSVDAQLAVSNSAAFGGQNAVLAVAR